MNYNTPSNLLKSTLRLIVCAFSLTACGNSEDTLLADTSATESGSTSDDGSDDTGDEDTGDEGDSEDDDSSDEETATDTSCNESGDMAELVCAANTFMATLSATQQNNLIYDFSDSAAKTTWSNLPSVSRNGLEMGSLSTTQQAAAQALLQVALTEQGYQDLAGLLAADDYLVSIGAGSNQYGADHYYLAFIGEPW